MTPVDDPVYVQRIAALERANSVRFQRAETKRAVRAGRVSIADVLASPSDGVLGMRVWDLLILPPKFGRQKAGGVCKRAGVSSWVTVGDLTVRQRDELIKLLGGAR